MKNQINNIANENQLDPLAEKFRIMKLGKTQVHYAKRLKRTTGAISQALAVPTENPGLLARIARYSDYLEKQNSKNNKKQAA